MYNQDCQTTAGGIQRELRELAIEEVTAGARERFVRGLLRRKIGTRVIEDKAGGMVLEGLNARGGFHSMDATRSRHMTGAGRCYRDPGVVADLMGILHRGVRDLEKVARAKYLTARSNVLQEAATRTERDAINQRLQKLRAAVKLEAEKDYGGRSD